MRVTATPEFLNWLRRLRDERARGRIVDRIDRMRLGNLGDHKIVGGGVFELRINYGPGYRVYVARKGDAVVILLIGGDKGSQRRDIAMAKALAREV